MATAIGIRSQEASRSNPWWTDKNWAQRDPDLREIASSPLRYEPRALDGLEDGRLYILRGPRRVGKTVALKQTIRGLLDQGVKPTRIVLAAVDGWEAAELRTLVQRTQLPVLKEGETRYWFFDEISSVSGEWAQQIKWLRDNDPQFRNDTVVLTGSNASALTEANRWLAGRRGHGTAGSLDRVLLPMGFRTFALLRLDDRAPHIEALALGMARTRQARERYEECIPWLDALVTTWEEYLRYGGFPRAVAALVDGQPEPQDFLQDLFDVVFSDAFGASRLSTTAEMNLLERLWGAMGSPANVRSIGTDLDIDHKVVGRHIEYLRDAFLLWACPQLDDPNWTPRPRSQSKLYAVDPLLARLPHLRNPERRDVDPTVLTERQLGMSIRRRAFSERPSAVNDEFIFHVRTPARKEIDFVSPDLGNTAIEGKYTERGRWRSEAATVDASKYTGIMATRNVLDVSSPDGAWAVPASFLAYLLDL